MSSSDYQSEYAGIRENVIIAVLYYMCRITVMISDQLMGWSLVGLSSASIIYYTVWVVLLPFVHEEQGIHNYFPDRFYAVALPLLAGVIGLALIGGFVMKALMSGNKEKIQ